MKVVHLHDIIGGWIAQIAENFCRCQKEGKRSDEKREAKWKRRFVNKLHFKFDYSKREIAREFEVSRGFVNDWTKSENQDVEKDDRGWEKGKRRKWDQAAVERIKTIREQLKNDPDQPYWGPTAIEVEHRKMYPEKQPPPVRTIGQILSDLGLSDNQQKTTKRGALNYLGYPEHTIFEEIGPRVLEVDFVGEKHITGRSKPIHFMGFCFKHEPRLRHFQRVKGETTSEFKKYAEAFFKRFEEPSVVKMDNGACMMGGGANKRVISRTMQFLLSRKIYPVFSVPRQPATQATIEGSNSVFGRKFWNRYEFESVEEIDEKLKIFNEQTRRYLEYTPPDQNNENQAFEPVVYFTRQVHEKEETGAGQVKITNDTVTLSTEYIKKFVLGEWRLKEEKLLIRIEEEKQGEVESNVIKTVDFPIHEASKNRCEKLLS